MPLFGDYPNTTVTNDTLFGNQVNKTLEQQTQTHPSFGNKVR